MTSLEVSEEWHYSAFTPGMKQTFRATRLHTNSVQVCEYTRNLCSGVKGGHLEELPPTHDIFLPVSAKSEQSVTFVAGRLHWITLHCTGVQQYPNKLPYAVTSAWWLH